jgi:phytanoyl-CoA hydroxylase
MAKKLLSNEQLQQYNRDGYLIVRNYFSTEEIEKLYDVAIEDAAVRKNAINVNDSSGRSSKLSLWYKPGDDIYGLLTRSETIVRNVDKILDGNSSICHFHSKLMQKEPRVGGAWEWHQDYGYWYKNEFLKPDEMMSVMLAITEANKQNGCLQVIRNSHKMGRVEHGFSGEQVGASKHYVDLALKTMELVYVELNAGDILFFHSNILHRSEANLSDKPRWSMISVYNRASNIGYNDSAPGNSSTTPINCVADDAFFSLNVGGLSEDNADFLAKHDDKALKP